MEIDGIIAKRYYQKDIPDLAMLEAQADEISNTPVDPNRQNSNSIVGGGGGEEEEYHDAMMDNATVQNGTRVFNEMGLESARSEKDDDANSETTAEVEDAETPGLDTGATDNPGSARSQVFWGIHGVYPQAPEVGARERKSMSQQGNRRRDSGLTQHRDENDQNAFMDCERGVLGEAQRGVPSYSNLKQFDLPEK